MYQILSNLSLNVLVSVMLIEKHVVIQIKVNFKGRTSGNQSDFCDQALNLSMHID